MADVLLDSLEAASPYIIGIVVGIALGAGYILYKDRDYKQRIQCATCRKKMFSTSQDVPLSDFSENEQQNLTFMRHLVQTGQVSEELS
jgi:hypothetical protein